MNDSAFCKISLENKQYKSAEFKARKSQRAERTERQNRKTKQKDKTERLNKKS
jgi:hypothetical protein